MIPPKTFFVSRMSGLLLEPAIVLRRVVCSNTPILILYGSDSPKFQSWFQITLISLADIYGRRRTATRTASSLVTVHDFVVVQLSIWLFVIKKKSDPRMAPVVGKTQRWVRFSSTVVRVTRRPSLESRNAATRGDPMPF